MKTLHGLTALGISLSLSFSAFANYRVGYRIENKKRNLLQVHSVNSSETLEQPVRIRHLPYYIAHEPIDLKATYEEWEYPNHLVPLEALKFLKIQTVPFAGSELRTILEQGPKENRICLTFLGDGYTTQEKEKFFKDVEKTVKGLFETDTFHSYLPLFNVYAVFTPSAVSGIGDGRPKNTAFRLYRDPPGSKRAIMPGDEFALSRAQQMAPKTDYPIVLANDEFYGGLGGRWAITTSSEASGLIVLRHELGHNFGEVGEEYDNGYVYSGANSTRNPKNLPWEHWLDAKDRPKVYESQLLSGDYIWKNLNSGSYQANISIPKQHKFLEVILSTVGWETPEDVQVKGNGEPWTLNGVFHRDRSFFRYSQIEKPSSGRLNLQIEEKKKDGDNVLGFAVVYSMAEDYNFSPNVIAAFATYDNGGNKSYRPSHSSCLMRDMEVQHFCPIDQENMWLKFFERTRLIDSAIKTSDGTSVNASVKTLDLEGLSIRWLAKTSKGYSELSQYRNSKSIQVPVEFASSPLRVEVNFENSEIRKQNIGDAKDL